jgi:hypothetical protein
MVRGIGGRAHGDGAARVADDACEVRARIDHGGGLAAAPLGIGGTLWEIDV